VLLLVLVRVLLLVLVRVLLLVLVRVLLLVLVRVLPGAAADGGAGILGTAARDRVACVICVPCQLVSPDDQSVAALPGQKNATSRPEAASNQPRAG